MARHIRDDVRYMSHEVRIKEGHMAAPKVPDRDAERVVCCGCGKTVLKARGHVTGWVCPRVECSRRCLPGYEAKVAEMDAA